MRRERLSNGSMGHWVTDSPGIITSIAFPDFVRKNSIVPRFSTCSNNQSFHQSSASFQNGKKEGCSPACILIEIFQKKTQNK